MDEMNDMAGETRPEERVVLDFEAFDRRRPGRIPRNECSLHIARRGLFGLSKGAYDLMGDPERVALAYDREHRIIRLAPTGPGDENAYELRRLPKSSRIGFQSSEFLDYFGIPHDDARIVPVRVENSVAFAYLDEGEFVAKRQAKIGVVRSGGGLDEEAFPTIQAAYLWLQDNTKETLTYQSLLKACHAGCGYKGFDWRLAGE